MSDRELEVFDPGTKKVRLLSEMCKTCIMRPSAERIAIGNERTREFISEVRQKESYVICHSTLPGVAPDGVEPAICRGFKDAYSTNGLRVAERLVGFVEVDPPVPPDPVQSTGTGEGE